LLGTYQGCLGHPCHQWEEHDLPILQFFVFHLGSSVALPSRWSRWRWGNDKGSDKLSAEDMRAADGVRFFPGSLDLTTGAFEASAAALSLSCKSKSILDCRHDADAMCWPPWIDGPRLQALNIYRLRPVRSSLI
jgi:hypothetical protein